MIILAPTGVAAINAGGVTIHSFFQMPFGPWIPGGREMAAGGDFDKGLSAKHHHFSREKRNIIRSVDLIVIDEISMVRADLLDGIDELLRRFRDRGKPFGGVQLCMIGDIQQLAPVVKDEEWEVLKQYYETPFFFGSTVLKESSYVTIELKNVYRQSDPVFIDLLNRVRRADGDPETFSRINKRYVPDLDPEAEGCIILTTHNHQAKRINEERMGKLNGASFTFTARVEGDFPEYSFPTDSELVMKSGALVMFVKNDPSPEKRYFNGKIGTVTSIGEEIIYVKSPDDGTTVAVGPETWQNARYGIDEAGEIVETVIGTFTQYPLKAAWAITIHKSQGLTFDKVVIDAAAAFAHGQVYVALSRCRSLDGLFLTSPLSPRVLVKNASVSEFSEKIRQNQPEKEQLQKAAVAYRQSLLYELFDFSRIQNQSGYLLRNLFQNKEILFPGALESFRTMDVTITTRMVAVAARFNREIERLLLENPEIGSNLRLQERVKKATSYFKELLNSCAAELAHAEDKLDIDNKDIRKVITVSLQRLQADILSKVACMESCGEGFTLKAYLEARSKGTMEKPVSKKRGPARPEADDGDTPAADAALLARLKEWRHGKAREEDIPEFMILHQSTMMRIASALPSSPEALKGIRGMGKKKVGRFGEEILRLVSDRRSENDMESSPATELSLDKNAECGKEKIPTRKLTFDLFESGRSLSEIASERNLALSTIEGHLAHYIKNGDLGIDRFLSFDKVSRIREYFLAREKRELSPAKSHFGEEFTYGELRMVLAHMDRERE